MRTHDETSRRNPSPNQAKTTLVALAWFAAPLASGCGFLAPGEPDEAPVIVITDDESSTDGTDSTSGNDGSSGKDGSSTRESPESRIAWAEVAVDEAAEDAGAAFCGCYAGEGEMASCLVAATPGFSPSACEKSAGLCDVDSLVSVYECKADALATYEDCIDDCPSDPADARACGEAFETNAAACDELISDELERALSQCTSEDAVPTCGEPAPTEEEMGGEQCADFFRQNIASNEEMWMGMFGVDDGTDQIVEECDRYGGDGCVTHILDFFGDGTVWHNWIELSHVGTSINEDGFCETATWEVTSCNEFRISHCNGATTQGMWILQDNGGLVIDAEWYLDGEIRHFQQTYWSIGRNGGEAYGASRGDCYSGVSC